RGARARERLRELGRPDSGIPELEVAALPDHHGVALKAGVRPQRRGEKDAPRAVGADVLFEAQEQALPPARLRVEAGEAFDLHADRLPFGDRIDEDAAVGM